MSDQTLPNADEAAAYRGIIASALNLSVPLLPSWERLLLPTLSNAVDKMIAAGDLPIEVADAFDDIGQFCQRLGSDIMAERKRRGMPQPPGPDDSAV